MKRTRKVLSLFCAIICVLVFGASCSETDLPDGSISTDGNDTDFATSAIDSAATACAHEWADQAYVAPTCTSDGMTEGKVCTLCGESTCIVLPSEQYGHMWFHHPYKAPTATENGMTEGDTCTVCGKTTYEIIPATGSTTSQP